MSLVNKKCLIAYYSRRGQNYLDGVIVDLSTGNTEVIAGMIQKITGADIFHIETVKPYPVDYNETVKLAKIELRNDARPELAGRVDNFQQYDIIFLGYPNWCGTMPMPVFTFLNSYDFSGKTIIPFCTHEGSGLGRSEQHISILCPKSGLLNGIAIRGSEVGDAGNTVSGWIKKLKFNELKSQVSEL